MSNYGDYGENKLKTYNSVYVPVSFPVQVSSRDNILYNSDLDSDGILNENDNCLKVSNSDQKDINYNEKGDLCEDLDSDGVLDYKDNCPNDRNHNQQDLDSDGIGDVCDESDDRFLESNMPLVYVLIVISLFVFIALSVLVMKKK